MFNCLRITTATLHALVVLATSITLWGSHSVVDAAERDRSGWDALPQILAQIKSPKFADRDFDISTFGAVDDGQTNCLPAISAAIAACHESGGGRVLVPPGKWLVAGPINLLSHVNLHLAEGATVAFSTQPEHYLPGVLTRFEGTELINFSPLVYALDQQNLAITGSGTLDGQAGENRWWHWKGPWGGDVPSGWHEGDPDQRPDVGKLGELADAEVPPTERVFGAGHRLRPNFVQFYRCENVLVEGIHLVNSPMWVLHPVLSSNVTVRKVTVDSHGPNNDGCNPESCRNVLVEGCQFNTGDDCIAIKSGRNADGRRLATPSENIIVRHCQMRDGHGGVVLGSEMSGGIRNIFVEHCQMDSPRLERAIRLKSNSLRGGYLENLYVRHLDVGEVSDAVLRINLEYGGETGVHFPTVRNIFLDQVTSRKSLHPLYLVGLAEQPIENVQVRRSTFASAKKPSILEHVQRLEYLNVSQPR
jgi:polygalacturonase